MSVLTEDVNIASNSSVTWLEILVGLNSTDFTETFPKRIEKQIGEISCWSFWKIPDMRLGWNCQKYLDETCFCIDKKMHKLLWAAKFFKCFRVFPLLL